jgi:Holliday junction resolvase
MTLYRSVELVPGVRLEPAPSGRAATLVVDTVALDVTRVVRIELDVTRVVRVELDEAALERAVEAAREALE